MFAELFVGFTFFYCLSKKSLWLIDLTGPAMVVVLQVTNAVALLVFFPKSEDSSLHISITTFQFYPLFIQFCEGDYLIDFTTRMIYCVISRFLCLD